MNKKQKKILEFLAIQDSSKFSTQEEISTNTEISLSEVASECYKLRKENCLEIDGTDTRVKPKYRITTFGQNQLDHEYDRKENLGWMKKTTGATIGLLIVTGILAIGTIMLTIDSNHQTELFQQDFDTNNRPWIGVDKMDVYNDKIVISFKNYGKIPNGSGTINVKFTNYFFEKEDIHSKSEEYILHVTMPGQIMKNVITSDMYDEMMLNAKNREWEIFLGAEINYPYKDNSIGNYGFIGKYNPESNKIDILETWGS